jgi:hypothetical protein
MSDKLQFVAALTLRGRGMDDKLKFVGHFVDT